MRTSCSILKTTLPSTLYIVDENYQLFDIAPIYLCAVDGSDQASDIRCDQPFLELIRVMNLYLLVLRTIK